MKKIFFAVLFLLSGTVYSQSGLDFNKLNQLYYRIDSTAFPGFSAEVESQIVNQFREGMKDAGLLNTLDSLRFTLEFYSPSEYYVKASEIAETGNPQTDAGISQMIDGVKKMVAGSMQSWSEIAFNSAYEPDKFNYVTEKNGETYKVSYSRDNAEVADYLDADYDIDSIIISSNGTYTLLKPRFSLYKEKRLMDSFEMSMLSGQLVIDMKVEYKELGDYMIPETIYIMQKGFGSELNTNIKLVNITLHAKR